MKTHSIQNYTNEDVRTKHKMKEQKTVNTHLVPGRAPMLPLAAFFPLVTVSWRHLLVRAITLSVELACRAASASVFDKHKLKTNETY